MTLRLTFRARAFSLLAALGMAAEIGIAVALVAARRLGLTGVFCTMILASATQMAIGLALTYRSFAAVFSRQLLGSMLSFGLPLVPAGLALWILTYSNRYFLTWVTNLQDVAVLSVAFRLSAGINLLNAAFQYAWPPFAYSLLGDRAHAADVYSRVLTAYLLVTLGATVALTMLSREALIVLAPPAYASAAWLVPWLCFSTIAWGVAGIAGIGFEIAKKSYHFSIAAGLGAIVTTALNALLIPKAGITGAAVAPLIGNLAALSYCYVSGQRYFPVPYQARKLAILAGLAILAVAGVSVADRLFQEWRVQALLLKVLVGALFVAGLLVFRVLRLSDVLNLRHRPSGAQQIG